MINYVGLPSQTMLALLLVFIFLMKKVALGKHMV